MKVFYAMSMYAAVAGGIWVTGGPEWAGIGFGMVCMLLVGAKEK